MLLSQLISIFFEYNYIYNKYLSIYFNYSGYSYFIEVSADKKRYKRVIDHKRFKCR